MTAAPMGPIDKLENSYARFHTAKTAFDSVSTRLQAQQNGVRADRAWQIETIQNEVSRLTASTETIEDFFRRQNWAGRVKFERPMPASTPPADDGMSISQLGEHLSVMRDSYHHMRQAQEELIGDYIEPTRRIPIIQRLLFLIAVVAILLIVGNAGFTLIRLSTAYIIGAQAVGSSDWAEAINNFTFSYTNGPFLDSEMRLRDSYLQAIEENLNGQDWGTARAFIDELLPLNLDNDYALASRQTSYILPAQSAYSQRQYEEVRTLLDFLPPPLDENTETLYKNSLIAQAEVLITGISNVQRDWATVESLMLELRNDRPPGLTSGAERLELRGLELLSQSYTARASALIDEQEWVAARNLLMPARSILNVPNNAIAERLFLDTYYKAGRVALVESEYEEAHDNFLVLVDPLVVSPPFEDSLTRYFDTFYFQARDLMRDELPDYEVARALFEQMFDEYGQSRTYDNGILPLYYDTFRRPAQDFMNAEPPDYVAARDLFEVMFGRDSLSRNHPGVLDDYFDTFYLPARDFMDVEPPDYAAAQNLFEQMFEADEASWDHGDSRQRYWDTFYEPAKAFLYPTPESGDEPNYVVARDLFEQMFEADAESRSYPGVLSDYYDTFYRLANEKLFPTPESGDDPDYEDARALFEQMFAADNASWNHEDARQKYWDTFYLEAEEALALDTETEEDPDYLLARALFEQMFAADPTSRDYENTTDYYLRTYYFPARQILESDPQSDAPSDYQEARELLAFVKEYNPENENYRGDTLSYYYDTWYLQVKNLLDVETNSDIDYQAIKTLLEDMFDTDNRSRIHREAQSIYWNSIYFPALTFYNNHDYLSARSSLEALIADGGIDHYATQEIYLRTFYQRGLNFLDGNPELSIGIDYDLARDEFEFLIDYAEENGELVFSDATAPYFKTYLRPGQVAMEAADYDEARIQFGALLQLRDLAGSDSSAWLDLYQETYLEPARAALDAADPDYDEARAQLYLLLGFEGQTPDNTDEALRLLTQAYHEPAQKHLDNREWQAALDLLLEFYNYEEDNELPHADISVDKLTEAYKELIYDAIDLRDFDTAQDHILALQTINPDYSVNSPVFFDYYYERGVNQLENGQWIEAQNDFDVLAQINPNYSDAITQLFQSYYLPAETNLKLGIDHGNADLCASARDYLQGLLDLPEFEGGDFGNARALFNQTFVCQIDIAIQSNDMEMARDRIVALRDVSPYYAAIEQQFIQTFYDPAEKAMTEGDYGAARGILDGLIQDTATPIDGDAPFFYNDAFVLLRETFYEPGLRALDAGQWKAARTEFDSLIDIDPDYRDVQLLLRESYFRPGQQALNAGDWDSARQEFEALVALDMNFISPDDEAAQSAEEYYRDTFRLWIDQSLVAADWDTAHQQAEVYRLARPDKNSLDWWSRTQMEHARFAFQREDWATVREQSDTLLERNPLYAETPEAIWLNLESYYKPASDAYADKQWTLVRTHLSPLRGLVDRLFTQAEMYPELVTVLRELNVVEDPDGSRRYNDSLRLLYDAMLISGIEAMNPEDGGRSNWQEARDRLGELLTDNRTFKTAHTDYVQRYGNIPAQSIYIDAFLTPGLEAYRAENWTFAQKNFRLIVGHDFRYASVIQRLQTIWYLINSYQIPLDRALTLHDWEVVRAHIDHLLVAETALLDRLPPLVLFYESQRLRSYKLPVQEALETEAYDAARHALEQYAEHYGDDTAYYKNTLFSTYERPLTEAIALQDWFSAADHYVVLREEGYIPAAAADRVDSLLTDHPQVGEAIANRVERSWVTRTLDTSSVVDYDNPHATRAIMDAAWNPSGTRFATAHADGALTFWAVNDQQPQSTVFTGADWLRFVEWEPQNGDWLAASGADEQIYIFDTASGQRLTVLEIDSPVTSLAISPDGTRLVAGGDAGEIVVWDSADWAEPAFTLNAGQSVTALAVAPNNTVLIAAAGSGSQGQIVLFDLAARSEFARLETQTYTAQILATPDPANKTTFITLGHDNRIQRWHIQDGTVTAQEPLEGHQDWLRGGTFLANGRILATLDASGIVHLWAVDHWTAYPGKPINNLPSGTLPGSISFSPDGRSLLVSDSAPTGDGVLLWGTLWETYRDRGEGSNGS